MGIWYRTGTVSIVNGTAAVTGSGTAFLSNVKPGDGITLDGGSTWYEALSVESNTALTLATNFTGTTVSGGSYASDRRSPRWTWPSEFERVVEFLSSAPAIFRGEGDPSSTLGSEGSFYIDTAGSALWHRTSSAWEELLVTAGSDGTDGATIRTGSGAPSNGMGDDGDIYIDLTNGRLYGTKTAGAWPGDYTSLRGPKGDAGTGAKGDPGVKGDPGKQTLYGAGAPSSGDGLDGDFWIDTTNSRLYGPKASGAWPGGYVSIIGPKGDKGDTGSTGNTGPSGSTVEVWGLAVSASAGALTVALKRPDGSDPSGGSPVTLAFKNTTLASGTPVELSRTSALSLTLTSGSTLGAVAGVPLRVWFVAFNDASTMRIAAVNCRGDESILALDEAVLKSATSEGGAGAADSAEVLYSNAAVSSKAIRILGYAQWNAGLATPGSWTAPSVVHVFTRGSKRPGDVVRQVSRRLTSMISGTTLIPADATKPQISEGTLLTGVTYQPEMPANVLNVDAVCQLSNSAIQYLALALFKDGGADAVSVGMQRAAAAYPQQVGLNHRDITGSSSASFQLRAGGGAAGTTYLNGHTTVNYYGGAMPSHVTLTEIMA